jgi:hypothetical protein
MQIIIYITTAVGLAIGILLISWRLCTRQHGTQEPDVEADAFGVVPAAGASNLASPIEPPRDDVEVSTEPRWA